MIPQPDRLKTKVTDNHSKISKIDFATCLQQINAYLLQYLFLPQVRILEILFCPFTNNKKSKYPQKWVGS